jgi:hypothetical protein
VHGGRATAVDQLSPGEFSNFRFQVTNMPLPHVLEMVRRRPLMYLRSVEFDVVVAFVDGFDTATNHGLLVGFREWLVLRLNDGNNLAWSDLLLMIDQSERAGTPSAATEEARVAFLFATLEEFFAERERPEGIRSIFVRYDDWLRAQEWYGPGSPGWQPRFGDAHSKELGEAAGRKQPKKRPKRK